MNRRPYASEVTKAYLQKLGIEYVSTDGKEVIKNGEPANIIFSDKTKKPYGNVTLYDPDIRAAVPQEERKKATGNILFGIHVLNYVWNVADKPDGMVIDHIDNDPRNNDLSNLQCITQRENLAKDRDNWDQYELKCKLNKPRSFYEQKLEGYLLAHEQAKQEGDSKAAHHLRCNISQTRARLRYYDNHILEAIKIKQAKEAEEARKRENKERAQTKKKLRENVDSTRKYYKQVREAYGDEDPYVKKMWSEWKLAIAKYHGFCAETKVDAQ